MSITNRRKRNRPEPEAHFVQLTPSLAEKWLSKNTHNRKVRQSRVNRYARDMAADAWLVTGQDAIVFDWDGAMRNGQHRCLAVIKSGTTITQLVTMNIDPSAQKRMDIGGKRSMGDILELEGEGSAATLAAVLRKLVALDAGLGASADHHSPTEAQMEEYLNAHPTVRNAVRISNAANGALSVPGSVIGAAYHLCSRVNREDADEFFETQVIEGLGLALDDPARALRVKLGKLAEGSRRTNADDVLLYTLHAWNLFRTGKQVTKLQRPKNFPHPR